MGRFARALPGRPPPPPPRTPPRARPRLLLPRAAREDRCPAHLRRREPPAVPPGRLVAARPRDPARRCSPASIMFTQSWQLPWPCSRCCPVLFFASRWYRPRAFDVQLGYRESMANLLNHVNEALVGMRVVQAYGIEHQQRDTFAGINDAAYDARIESGRVTAIYYAIIEFLNPAALDDRDRVRTRCSPISGEIEVGTLVAFTLYLTRLFEPIQQFTELNTLAAGRERGVHAYVRLPRARAESSSTRPTRCRSGAAPALIRIDARDIPLRTRRPTGRRGPRPHGPRRANASRSSGTSGAGKSTLAKLIGRFYDPTDGRRRHRWAGSAHRAERVAAPSRDGRPSGGVPVRRHDRRQHHARPSRRRSRTEIDAAVSRRSGFADVLARIPGGLDARVANRGLTLSSGQRQLVALHAHVPRRSRRSSCSTKRLRTSIRRPTRSSSTRSAACSTSRTAIVIAHRVGTALRADRVIVMEHGRRRGTGTARSARRTSEGAFAAVGRGGAGRDICVRRAGAGGTMAAWT